MTAEERKRLAAGCVGITRLNLGGSAPLNECYKTYPQAQKRADELEKEKGERPYIFSKRFWTMGKAYTADANGKIDMSGYNSKDVPPDAVNFDYAWHDEVNDTWWHANHCDPVTGSARCRSSYDPNNPKQRMKVYQSTLAHYSDPQYFAADKQVFCVAWSKL
jgi:hypothetical protein